MCIRDRHLTYKHTHTHTHTPNNHNHNTSMLSNNTVKHLTQSPTRWPDCTVHLQHLYWSTTKLPVLLCHYLRWTRFCWTCSPCLVGWHWRSLLGSSWKKRFSHVSLSRMWQRQYGMGQGERSRCGKGSSSAAAHNPSRRTMTSSSQLSTWKSLLTHWQITRSFPMSPFLSS